MKIERITLGEGEKYFKTLQNGMPTGKEIEERLSKDYKQIRKAFSQIDITSSKNPYEIDLEVGLAAYTYFKKQDWFNESIASDYDFWRYICLEVVPDLIADRHGLADSSRDYFYNKNVRLYIPTMYWFYEMSYFDSPEKTKEMLSALNTDYIMNLVERPGRGIYLEVSREIMRVICLVGEKERNKKLNDANLFRRVMIQNTARIENYNLVFENNAKEYVKQLFIACGVDYARL